MQFHSWGSETNIIARERRLVNVSVEFSSFLGLGLFDMQRIARRNEVRLDEVESNGLVFPTIKLKFKGGWKNLNGVILDLQDLREEKMEDSCPYCHRRFSRVCDKCKHEFEQA